MCLGLPMQVLEAEELSALVARGPDRRRVSLLLVGPVEVGATLLIHCDTAVRILDAVEAEQLESALRGLEAALKGEDIAAFFPDLVGREPVLPDHLIPSRSSGEPHR